MLNWQNAVMQEERYQDLLREARAERLMRQAVTPTQPRDRFYRRALAWTSRQLVAWGLLQERVGSTAPAPALELVHLPR